MSMTLYLWKAPVIDDSDEAERLITAFEEQDDDSPFEASDAIANVADELRRRFPFTEDGPWADFPPEPTDRVLVLSIRWSADDAVLDAITQLAREHELVLYDPQGPDVGIPPDPAEVVETPPGRFVDYLKIVGIGLAAAGVFWLGWWIDVPVLEWILMIIGGFFVSVVVFLLVILLAAPKDEPKQPN